MILAAHPDDEILGCGATAARLIDEGFRGKSVILSQGMLSRGEEYRENLGELHDATLSANNILGIDDVKFHDYPDNAFDTVPRLEIIKCVEQEIDDFQPDIIFTHFGHDLNIDHRRTFEAVLTACRPIPGEKQPDIYSFFVPSSTDWTDGNCMKSFVPNVFVDVSASIERKLEALNCYTTEMREYPHSRSLESIRIFSQYWGNRVGIKWCEPLILVRKIMNNSIIF